MPVNLYRRVRLVPLLLLTCWWAEAQVRVREITIHSGWGGLGTPQDETISIRTKNGKLVRNGKGVDQSNVDTLIAALKASVVPAPDPSNLGIMPAWLDAQIADQKGRFQLEVARATASQRALLVTSLKDRQKIERIVPALFRYMRTDDYPGVTVEATFDDGTKLRAETHSYYPFMLPWAIVGQSEPTYNADISRAVANLLGKKSPNKDRLAGSTFAAELVETTKRSIEREWNLLGSEDRAGDALAALRARYEVVESEIHPYHHPEYGTATYKGEPEQVNLHVSLRKPSFPPSVSVALVLQQVGGKVEGVERFLASAEKYESRALSVPWLNQYIKDNPRIPVRISYVQDYSFGEKALRTFVGDMQFRDRPDLIAQVRAQQQEIVLFVVGRTYSEAYWILFPDQHMLLWRFGGPSGLLKWTAADFPAGECADYKTNYGGCSGREITPSGELAAERTPRDQVCMASSAANKSAPDTHEPLFPVEDRGRGGFIDVTGRIAIPLCFDAVGDFSEGLARFERDKKWGYIDKTGAVVIEPRFPWAQEFSEGLARVQVAGSRLGIDARWGFIDKTGVIVIDGRKDPSFGEHSNIGSDSAESAFHDGLALIDVDGRKGYIDKTGTIVIAPQFAYAYPFSEGLAAATKSESAGEGWGHIDKTGRWIVEPKFQWASSFSDGLAPVNRTRNCGYVDAHGTLVLQPKLSPGETDCATVWGDFVNGLARWKFENKYGFIDRTGKTVIEPKYDLTFHFSEGFAAVMVGGKWGYIDTRGKMVIQPMPLQRAEDFHHGLAFVSTKDGKYGYIDKSGKYVWSPTLLYRD
ncbi:MAG: WG repeat-containing protein [Acidobacteriota bacterium]